MLNEARRGVYNKKLTDNINVNAITEISLSQIHFSLQFYFTKYTNLMWKAEGKKKLGRLKKDGMIMIK
jgi:hypothetical protein